MFNLFEIQYLVPALVRSFEILPFPDTLPNRKVYDSRNEPLSDGKKLAKGIRPEFAGGESLRDDVQSLVSPIEDVDDRDPFIL